MGCKRVFDGKYIFSSIGYVFNLRTYILGNNHKEVCKRRKIDINLRQGICVIEGELFSMEI